MTGSTIQPVVFPTTRIAPNSSPAVRLPLPLPVSPLTRSSTAIYGAAAVDNRGRIIEKPLLTALGWSPGTGVDIQESQGRVVIHSSECFVTMITKHGHLRLPATIRHRCGLRGGDQVLLAADIERQILTVYPPASLDLLLAGGRS